MSKSYALAGLRFGYLVAQPNLIAQLSKVKDSYNCDALAIAGATAALADTAWLEENVRRVVANREVLQTKLSEFGFDVVCSRANFVWCRHPEIASKTIYEELKQRGILVRYMEFPDWGSGLRVSVGTEAQQQALFQMLAEVPA